MKKLTTTTIIDTEKTTIKDKITLTTMRTRTTMTTAKMKKKGGGRGIEAEGGKEEERI